MITPSGSKIRLLSKTFKISPNCKRRTFRQSKIYIQRKWNQNYEKRSTTPWSSNWKLKIQTRIYQINGKQLEQSTYLLSKIAEMEPQAAYAAFIGGFKSKFTYFPSNNSWYSWIFSTYRGHNSKQVQTSYIGRSYCQRYWA